MSKRNKVLVGSGAVALIAILVVVSAGARRDRGVEVRFENVAKRDLVAAVTASGKIQPKKKVDISADITGRITKLAVREGDLVTNGQFLLQIDPTIYEANLQRAQALLSAAQAGAVQARANRDQAQRALGRTKELHQQNPNLISTEQLEQAETANDIAEANLNAAEHQVDQSRAAGQEARDNLRKTHITAPMSGRVTKISNPSILTATSTATGQNERAVDYEVEITLNPPPADVRPDLSATARVVTDTRKQVLSIPIIALTVRENKPISTENRPADTSAFTRKKREAEGVFVVTNGVAAFRPVKVGIAGDEYFEVADGVKQGETIVAGPYQSIRDLKDSARVRPMKQAADSTKKKK